MGAWWESIKVFATSLWNERLKPSWFQIRTWFLYYLEYLNHALRWIQQLFFFNHYKIWAEIIKHTFFCCCLNPHIYDADLFNLMVQLLILMNNGQPIAFKKPLIDTDMKKKYLTYPFKHWRISFNDPIFLVSGCGLVCQQDILLVLAHLLVGDTATRRGSCVSSRLNGPAYTRARVCTQM